MGVTANKIGVSVVRATNSVVNIVVLVIIVLLLFFAGYALWDSEQIFQGADKKRYETYKPTEENKGKSFKELQAINSEVFAWLTVYGTNIDYPVTQGENNMKYINTNAEGQYAMTGAIFLDSGNSKDFSDFNSILYGHHMHKDVMFGEIGNFANKNMFDTHRYGNLYYDGKDHGIEFFAFVHCDAYDWVVFDPNVQGEAQQQEYLNHLLSVAVHSRDIGVTIQDNIVLLSTCSSTSTNGRDILIGRLSDTTYADSFEDAGPSFGEWQLGVDSPLGFLQSIPHVLWAMILILAALLLATTLVIRKIRKKNRGEDT